MSGGGFSSIRKSLLAARGCAPTDRAILWRMSGGRCFWCDETMSLAGSPVSLSYMTVDHVETRSDKLPRLHKVAACRRCNGERGSKSAEHYWAIWAMRLHCAECTA